MNITLIITSYLLLFVQDITIAGKVYANILAGDHFSLSSSLKYLKS